MNWLIFLIIWASSYQSNQIPRVFTAEVSAAAQDNQRHKEDCVGHVVRPWITAYKVLGISNKSEDSNKGGSDEQLHGENWENLKVGEEKWHL